MQTKMTKNKMNKGVEARVAELKARYPDDVVAARVRHRTTDVSGRGTVTTTKDVFIDGYLAGWCRETIPFSIFKGLTESYTAHEIYETEAHAALALVSAGFDYDPGNEAVFGVTGAGCGLDISGDPYNEANTRRVIRFLTSDKVKGMSEGDPLRHLLLLYDTTMKPDYEKLGPPTAKGPFDEDEGMPEEHRKTGEELFSRAPNLPGFIGGRR